MLHPQPTGAASAGGDGAAFSWKTEPIAQLQYADHLTGLEPQAASSTALDGHFLTAGTVITYSCHFNPVFFS